MKQDLLSLKDWTADQLHSLLALAKTIKNNPAGSKSIEISSNSIEINSKSIEIN